MSEEEEDVDLLGDVGEEGVTEEVREANRIEVAEVLHMRLNTNLSCAGARGASEEPFQRKAQA